MNIDTIAISLDLINRHHQEPNRNRYESRYFWEELYPLVAAAGFAAIEIPYEPVWQFGGRSGVPFNRYCVNVKYGSAAGYRETLRESGIARVTGITFDPNLFMRNDNLDFYFGATGHFAGEAIGHAADMGAEYVAVSPSPFLGRILQYHPDIANDDEGFKARTIELLSGLAAKAQDAGVTLTLRNEFWSVFRGAQVVTLLDALPGWVRIDFDPATLSVAGLSPAAFFRDNVERIGSVHLTDTSYVDSDETWKTPNPEFPRGRATQVFRDPGTGSVDLAGLVKQIDASGWQGPVTLSARQTRDPFRALLRMRALLDTLKN